MYGTKGLLFGYKRWEAIQKINHAVDLSEIPKDDNGLYYKDAGFRKSKLFLFLSASAPMMASVSMMAGIAIVRILAIVILGIRVPRTRIRRLLFLISSMSPASLNAVLNISHCHADELPSYSPCHLHRSARKHSPERKFLQAC